VAVDIGDANFEAEVRKDLDATLAEVMKDHPDVTVTPVVVEGHPAQVMVEASRDAELLVVGSRGRGAFTGMVLGSVSQHCVQQAECPVVVVHQRS
jgi:nucleotide-binding universal stress UspA family protein